MWVCANVVVYQPLLKIAFSLGVLKHVCIRDVMGVVFSVCIVTTQFSPEM